MMNTTLRTAVGSFDDRHQAQQAVEALRRAGFREDQIGIITRDEDRSEIREREEEEEEVGQAGSGAATGAAAGAGVGALWGLGVLAGLLPAVGPVIAGGTLAAILASAAAGAAAGGILGALLGLGIPEEEAAYYEEEFKSGRTLVTVRADGRYDEARAILQRFGSYDYHAADRAHGATHALPTTPHASYEEGQDEGTVVAHEEELRVHKEPRQTGDVRVHKEVHTEHRTVDVPVSKEEVVVERGPATGRDVSDLDEGEELRIPVTEEEVRVEKEPVAKEEVHVRKRTARDVRKVGDTVRREDIQVEGEGDVDIRDETR